MKSTPVTKVTKLTAQVLAIISFLTLIVRIFWSNNWIYLVSWVVMLLAFLCLYRGITQEGY